MKVIHMTSALDGGGVEDEKLGEPAGKRLVALVHKLVVVEEVVGEEDQEATHVLVDANADVDVGWR